jgi:hypothetical protein
MSEKIEQFYRRATADDVARVMKGEAVEARFRDESDGNWSHGTLCGWSVNEPRWYARLPDGMHGWAMQCQVYDPPEWYINKPDPGEGFRLLEKFPPEELQPGDEWFEPVPFETGWKTSHNEKQANTIWYRRRIANNPEIPDSSNSSETPDSCRSSDTIPSGFRVLGEDEERLASDAFWSLGCKEWIVLGDDRVKYANELPRWRTIRQTTNVTELSLIEGFGYVLPGGGRIRVTAKGFDVLQ